MADLAQTTIVLADDHQVKPGMDYKQSSELSY
jgi:hypothetical protein